MSMKHPQMRQCASPRGQGQRPTVSTPASPTVPRTCFTTVAGGPARRSASTSLIAVAATVLALAGAQALALPTAVAAQTAAQATTPTTPTTPSSPTADEPAYVDAAEAAARSWLQKLDAGDYRGTWDSAAAPFRKAITRDKWEADVGAVRKAVGALQERNNRGARFTRSLPGAPDGDYVLIQNDTRFQNKSAAIETVTMAREADGVWRLAGYFVR